MYSDFSLRSTTCLHFVPLRHGKVMLVLIFISLSGTFRTSDETFSFTIWNSTMWKREESADLCRKNSETSATRSVFQTFFHYFTKILYSYSENIYFYFQWSVALSKRKRFLLYHSIEIGKFQNGRIETMSTLILRICIWCWRDSPCCTLVRYICSGVGMLFLRSFP